MKLKRSIALLLAVVLTLALVPFAAMPVQAASEARSYYNSSTGDVFLGGKYIELGISKRGSFGTSASAPSGFHSSGQLGMLVDGDGWDSGASPTTDDFFLPGSPEERYVLAYQYNGTTYTYEMAERNGDVTGTWKTAPTVSNQSSGDTLKAVVTGVTTHNIKLEITYSFGVNDKHYKTQVKITNESGVSVSNLRYIRSFDPDQDYNKKGTYYTYNKVICNPNQSKAGSDTNYAMVVARGEATLEGFFFIAFDNRAYACHGTTSDNLVPSNYYGTQMWSSSHSYPNYATDSLLNMSTSSTNGYVKADTFIALTFNLGTLAASASDSLEYYSSLSPQVEQSVVEILNPVAPTINSVSGANLAHGYTSGGPSISASVAANHTVSYQWYRSSTNSNSGGTKITGATSASYQVPLKHLPGTTEYYYCIVTATRTDNGLSASTTSSAVAVNYQTGTHSWIETGRRSAGCTSVGYVTYSCAYCEETKQDTIPALGHSHRKISTTAPTCTNQGYSTYSCATCGETYRDDYVEVLGHDYQQGELVQPTCTTDGYVVYRCARSGCGDTKRQTIAASGHDFGGDNVCDICGYTVSTHTHSYRTSVVAPTCTSFGYTTYTCSCGYSYRTDYIEQKGHSWDDGSVITAPTCTVDGRTTYTCLECGETKTEVKPAGHRWEVTVTSAPTCTADGYETSVCTVCGKEETVVLPAGHKWNEGTVLKAATCTEDGLKHVTCTVCGYSEEQIVDKLGHQFVNGVCIRCGATIEDIITPNDSHLLYGMYFEVDDVISNYGPLLINEYGVYLDCNEDAKIEKVAVYLTQEGNLWRRAIACTGTNIRYATYVPYLSYDEDVLYTGLNSGSINTFPLRENSDGIWCYSNYTTIGVNLQDNKGNLLLSLYDIGQAGQKTRVFDNLDDMVQWLKTPPITDDYNGWANVDGEWYYYKDGQPLTGWIRQGNTWYYLKGNGVMATGWIYYGGVWYYLRPDGGMAVGWQYADGKWYYLRTNGEMATGWVKDGGVWYYLEVSGAMASGWKQIGATWYYFRSSGAMATGWAKVGSTYYYFDSNGMMVTGWVRDSGYWYYMNSAGAMVTGKQQIGGVWYYFRSSGEMVTGWAKDGDTYYYCNASGAMITGWCQIGGYWYYFDSEGAMATGWKQIGTTRYYFRATGEMHTGWLDQSTTQPAEWLDAYEVLADTRLNYGYYDIDGDEIPELFISDGTTAGGVIVCTYHNGEVQATYMTHLAEVYTNGIIVSSGGSQGYYYDEVWKLENGQFRSLGRGSYEMVLYGNGSYTYTYSWNGSTVSESTYEYNLSRYASGSPRYRYSYYDGESSSWIFSQLETLYNSRTWTETTQCWYYFNSSGAMVTGSAKIGTKTYLFDSNGVCQNP